ncbi:MAG: DUF2779 domain-containing protein [Nodosilinea sp.]
MSYTLTKANILAGIQCHKRLWHEVNQPGRTSKISPDQQRIIDQGQEVGDYARQQFPHGLLIKGHGHQAIKETESAITSAATCLFEAAFHYGNILIRADILQRHPDNTWSLVEVKSSTKAKDEHLWDVAIQYYVLTRARLTIRDAALMVINNQDCFFPDLSNLFTLSDITGQVVSLSEQLPHHLQQFREMLSGQESPEQTIGQHCSTPNPCPFQEECWHHVPAVSIFTIPRLSWDKKHELIQQSRLALTDLPTTLKFTANQQAYVDTVLCNQPQFDYAGIASSLAELTYPIHFFDFETLNPAIPRFDGLKPFEQFPFQYSCHILQSNGTLEHHDYLHTDRTDPRRLLVKALTGHIAPAGSVVVYHKSFESKLLRDLAQTFPEYAEALLSINDRLWDQEDIFKHYYRHPAFLGKTSIKKVLPIVVPGLSYEGLDVQNGAIAQAIWDAMIKTQDLVNKQQLIEPI